MVDVGAKPATERRAVARAVVRLTPETAAAVAAGDAPKGDVIGVARIAGIQAAKRTSRADPAVPPARALLRRCRGSIDAGRGEIELTAEARTTGPTGVEMEALTAASVAALTVYDMVKGIERGAEIAAVAADRRSPAGAPATWRREQAYAGLGARRPDAVPAYARRR